MTNIRRESPCAIEGKGMSDSVVTIVTITGLLAEECSAVHWASVIKCRKCGWMLKGVDVELSRGMMLGCKGLLRLRALISGRMTVT